MYFWFSNLGVIVSRVVECEDVVEFKALFRYARVTNALTINAEHAKFDLFALGPDVQF